MSPLIRGDGCCKPKMIDVVRKGGRERKNQKEEERNGRKNEECNEEIKDRREGGRKRMKGMEGRKEVLESTGNLYVSYPFLYFVISYFYTQNTELFLKKI